MGARYVLDEGTSGAPTIASALENWCKLLAEVPGWTAESFLARYHLWNMRDEDIAKLMDGVTKSGVLEAEAKPDQSRGRLECALHRGVRMSALIASRPRLVRSSPQSGHSSARVNQPPALNLDAPR